MYFISYFFIGISTIRKEKGLLGKHLRFFVLKLVSFLQLKRSQLTAKLRCCSAKDRKKESKKERKNERKKERRSEREFQKKERKEGRKKERKKGRKKERKKCKIYNRLEGGQGIWKTDFFMYW